MYFSKTFMALKKALRGAVQLPVDNSPQLRPRTTEDHLPPASEVDSSWISYEEDEQAYAVPIERDHSLAYASPYGDSNYTEFRFPKYACTSIPILVKDKNENHTSNVTFMTFTEPSPVVSILPYAVIKTKCVDSDADSGYYDSSDTITGAAVGSPKSDAASIDEKSDTKSLAPPRKMFTGKRASKERHSVLWGCVDPESAGALPLNVFTIVTPASALSSPCTSYTFNKGTSDFEPVVKYLARETGRRALDDMVLVSKVYSGVVHDQRSLDMWMEWSQGRSAEDRTPWVM